MAYKKISIFLIAISLVITPFTLLDYYKNQQKTVEPINRFLFAVINDTGPKKERSQILAYVTIDDENKELLALIIPEDTSIEMSGIGYNRIKHAYYFKDLSLTSRSMAKFLGLRNEQGYYVAMDIKFLAGLIDGMGGIRVGQGSKTVGGNAAVEELNRGVKQREPEIYRSVILGIFEQLNKFASTFDSLIAFEDGVKYKDHGTSLKREDLKKIITSIGSLEKVTVTVLPGAVVEDDGVFYWAPEEDVLNNLRTVAGDNGLIAAIRSIDERESIAGTAEIAKIAKSEDKTGNEDEEGADAREYAIDVLNSGGIAGSAARTSRLLRDKGFNVGAAGNLPGHRYNRSVVVYKPGWEQEAGEVAGALRVSAVEPLDEDIGIDTSSQVIVVVGRDLELVE